LPHSDRLVLVTGATGYVGGRLVPRLLAEGYRVRCMVRDPNRLDVGRWGGAEIVRGDIRDVESLHAALRGATDAYYLIHSMARGTEDFARQDHEGAANFRDAAVLGGVGRIIFLGGLARPGAVLSPHLESRHETGRILRMGSVPVTEFRASVIVGSGSLSFELVRSLTERVPLIVAPRWLQTRCQPIGIRNVLQYLVAALEKPESAGKILEIGGRDVLSYGEMMKIYARERDLRRWIFSVPLPTWGLSARLVGMVTPIPAPIVRLLVDSLRNETVVTDFTALELFPLRPMSYTEALRLALQRVQEHDVETVWTGAFSSTPRQLPPPVIFTSAEGLHMEVRQRIVRATVDKVFDVVARIGGEEGWFYWNWIWRLRGILDRVVGGVGFRRGRRHPTRLRVGDPLDFWRVEAWDPPRLIRLRAEMRVPGLAWLQFEVVPVGSTGVLLKQTAFFEPKGLWGLAYWYALYPIHRVIFSGMIGEMARRAEQVVADSGATVRGR